MVALMVVLMVVHVGGPLEPHDLWRAWSLEPLTMTLLATAAALFTNGVRAVWKAAGVGRGVRKPNVWLLVSAWLILALSLLSPLHALGGALFSAHMAQHELLMTVAAPLLVLGRPLVPLVWAFPPLRHFVRESRSLLQQQETRDEEEEHHQVEVADRQQAGELEE